MYVYIYIYIRNHENNVPIQLSPQWLCGNSCAWAHDVTVQHLIIHHVPKCMSSHKGEGTLGGHIVFMILYKLRSSSFCEI